MCWGRYDQRATTGPCSNKLKESANEFRSPGDQHPTTALYAADGSDCG